MLHIRTLVGLIVLVLIFSVGLNFLMTTDANAAGCFPVFVIDDGEDNCGTLIPPVLGDGKVQFAGKSGNINAKCTGDNLFNIVGDSAFVEDGFCCGIKTGPRFFNIQTTRDSHIVFTPSGNVNVICKYHPDDEPQED